MNCPQCLCPVGGDQFSHGPWENELDEFGNLVGCSRKIWIHCPHCGAFEVVQDGATFIRKIHGPFASDKNIRRVDRHLAARHLEAIPS
jgi:hypothetical protein